MLGHSSSSVEKSEQKNDASIRLHERSERELVSVFDIMIVTFEGCEAESFYFPWPQNFNRV